MLVIVSPTKEWNPLIELPLAYLSRPGTRPHFQAEACELNKLLKKHSRESLERLMKISPSLAVHTKEKILSFEKESASHKPALLSYGGTQFKALKPESLSTDSLEYAQKHVRILSGLYGVLKPLDMIAPYRLEMKTALDIKGEGSLSVFWKSRITKHLLSDSVLPDPRSVLINLASKEYSSSVDRRVLGRKIINIFFKEKSTRGLKTVSMYAKSARGKMLRLLLEKEIDKAELIRDIGFDGYTFSPAFGINTEWEEDWVFTRQE